MKLILSGLLLWILAGFSGLLYAQDDLFIHHVNAGSGDATLIVTYSVTDSNYNLLAIIDAGNRSYEHTLNDYITNCFGPNTAWDYIIASHYHDDHIRGFDGLSNGTLKGIKIIDRGQYNLRNIAPNRGIVSNNIQPEAEAANATSKLMEPNSITTLYRSSVKEANTSYNLIRAPDMNFFPQDIGDTLVLDSINGFPIYLIALAGNGYTIADNANGYIDNPHPTKSNPNNFCLAFLIEYGEFRYYTGGDLGGSDNAANSCSNYIDQETPIADWFAANLQPAQSFNPAGRFTHNGHVCAMKTNHHGSPCSSNNHFLSTLLPTAIFTTYFRRARLPSQHFVNQVMNNVSRNAGQHLGDDVGLFFPALTNYKGNHIQTYCDTHLAPNYIFEYGTPIPKNPAPTDPPLRNYVIGVYHTTDLANESKFTVFRTTLNKSNVRYKWTPIHNFKCHVK